MIYQQQSHLPIIFQVDEDIILRANDFLKRNKLQFTNVLVVSGKTFSKNIALQITEKYNWNHYELADNSSLDVEELKKYVLELNTDLIVSVGGGKVIDTVKRVSYLTNINHFSIPTIISNDGLISPIAVIKNEQNRTESVPGMMPMGVLIDISIIQNSPINFLRAAAGDILSNISATNDWILAFEKKKERMNDIAFHLSKSAANALVHFNKIDLKSKAFLRMVIQGQINSGIAMSLAGTSRPCSGSEHLISHAIDHLELSSRLHGTQVASISLFTLFLQGKLKQKYVDYALATGIPLNFSEFIDGFSQKTFFQILDISKKMRPNRFTVLNTLKKEEIKNKFDEFVEKIEEVK